MPTAVGGSSASVNIPPVLIEGDAGSAPPGAASSPQGVTVPPVQIEGEANSVQQLVKAHDAAKAPRSCVSERVTAAYGALEVAGAVGTTVLGAALGPLGVAVGLAAVAGLSFQEGQKLRALYNCETE
jgi:hypothetical protein